MKRVSVSQMVEMGVCERWWRWEYELHLASKEGKVSEQESSTLPFDNVQLITDLYIFW